MYKHRLPEAPLRPNFQNEKIRWARHCQDIKRIILHSKSKSIKRVSKLAEILLESVYSLSAIRRGVSNQNNLEYCTDKYINCVSTSNNVQGMACKTNSTV
ncbi:hypothetical protein Avbf_15009 [Armadillidium vulgare]|nr:hypothetical protein Avbf_15009 [Armadillidium vulgare]